MDGFLRKHNANVDRQLHRYRQPISVGTSTATAAATDDDDATRPESSVDCSGNLFSMVAGNYRVEDHERHALFNSLTASIVYQNRPWYLTERQRRSPQDVQGGFGPLVIDFDFHYDLHQVTFPNQGTLPRSLMRESVLHELVQIIVGGLNAFVLDTSMAQTFEYAVFTQPYMHVSNSVDAKDGVHMMFFLQMSCAHNRLFREQMLKHKRDEFNEWAMRNHLPIVHALERKEIDWETVYDASVANGEANWTIWKCRKPGRDPYQLFMHRRRVIHSLDDEEDVEVFDSEVVRALENGTAPFAQQVTMMKVYSVRTVPPRLYFNADFNTQAESMWTQYVRNDCRWTVPRAAPGSVRTPYGSLHGLKMSGQHRMLTLDRDDVMSNERLHALAVEVDYLVNLLPITREEGLAKLRQLWTALLQPTSVDATLRASTSPMKQLHHFWNADYWNHSEVGGGDDGDAYDDAADDDDADADDDADTDVSASSTPAAPRVPGRGGYRWMPYTPSFVYDDPAQQARHEDLLKQMLLYPNVYQLAHLRQITDLVMALTGDYYNRQSHKYRIRICWALRDEHPALLAVWIFHVLRRYFDTSRETEVHLENDWNRVSQEWLPMWNNDKLVRTVTESKDGVSMLTIMQWTMQCNPAARVSAERRFWETLMEADVDGAYHVKQALTAWKNAEEDQDVYKVGRNDPFYGALTDANIAKYVARFYSGSLLSSNMDSKGNGDTPRAVFRFVDGFWVPFYLMLHDLAFAKAGTVRDLMQTSLTRLEQTKQQYDTLIQQHANNVDDNHPLLRDIHRLTFQVKLYQELKKILETTKRVACFKSLLLQQFFVDSIEDKLDQQLHLFPFVNGVFDAEQLQFRESVPDDLLTCNCRHVFLGAQLTPTEWAACVRGDRKLSELLCDREARREDQCLPHLCAGEGNFAARLARLREYLHRNFPHDEELRYMMAVFACMLRGDHQMEQFMHYIYGGGSNGKSTFWANFMAKVFGSLYATLPYDNWTTFGASDKPNPKLVAIKRARIWVTTESPQQITLNEMCIKAIVGSTDAREGRNLFENKIHEFIPQAMAFFISNYLVDLGASDFGVHRRMRVHESRTRFYTDESDILANHPREYQFRKEAMSKVEMTALAQVMLVLMVETYLETRGNIPSMPESMAYTTKQYLASKDPCGHFMSTRCEFTNDPNDFVARGEVTAQFIDWFTGFHGGVSHDERRRLVPQLHNNITVHLMASAEDCQKGWSCMRLK